LCKEGIRKERFSTTVWNIDVVQERYPKAWAMSTSLRFHETLEGKTDVVSCFVNQRKKGRAWGSVVVKALRY
jgi:hypothetical protein